MPSDTYRFPRVHRCNWKENVCATQCNKQHYSSRNLILTVSEFSSKIRACSKLTPRQLRNWVSIFLLARGMHFPLCNLKEWTSVVYKVWADVARYYAATKSWHNGAFVRPSNIQQIQNAHGHSTDALNCVVAYNYTLSRRQRTLRLSRTTPTLVSMRRWVFAEWTHRLESPSWKMDTFEEQRVCALGKSYLSDATNFLW